MWTNEHIIINHQFSIISFLFYFIFLFLFLFFYVFRMNNWNNAIQIEMKYGNFLLDETNGEISVTYYLDHAIRDLQIYWVHSPSLGKGTWQIFNTDNRTGNVDERRLIRVRVRVSMVPHRQIVLHMYIVSVSVTGRISISF